MFWLCGVGPATGQNLDPRTITLLSELVSIERYGELGRFVSHTAEASPTSATLWRDAYIIAAASDGARDAQLADAALRVLLAALFVDLKDQESLGAELSIEDPVIAMQPRHIDALETIAGFPGKADTIRYLLARSPTLRDRFTYRGYTVMRHAKDGLAILTESTTAPFRDLGRLPKRRVLEAAEDMVSTRMGEYASTRRVNLAILAPLVLAGHAAQAATLTPEVRHRAYALAIVAEVLKAALPSAPNDLPRATWVAQNRTLIAIEALDSPDPVLSEVAERMRSQEPSAAFFAQRFDRSAVAYREQARQAQTVPERVSRLWGEAISLLASRQVERAGRSLREALGLLGPETIRIAYALMVLRAGVVEDEAQRLFGDTTEKQWQVAKTIISDAQLDDSVRSSLDLDLAHVFKTIGRADIIMRHLFARIDAVRAMGADAERELESNYLYQIGSLTDDLANQISFEMSENDRWVARETTGYDKRLDFLHNLRPEGTLTQPGDIVILTTGKPYGMVNPAEDLATTFASYGYVEPRVSLVVGEVVRPEVAAAGVEAVRDWALAAENRREPLPSLAPYLKLLWIEWFSQVFEDYKGVNRFAQGFVYKPIVESGITTPSEARKRIAGQRGSANQRATLGLMLELRTFLESRYPANVKGVPSARVDDS